MITTCIGLHVKYRYSCQILIKIEFSRQVLEKYSHIYNFTKIRPVGAKFFHADGQKDMTKLTVACRNFANAPTNAYICKLIMASLLRPCKIYTLKCHSLTCQSHTPTTSLAYPELYAFYVLYLHICFVLFIYLSLSFPVSSTFTSPSLSCFITILSKCSTYLITSIPTLCNCYLFLQPKALLIPPPASTFRCFPTLCSFTSKTKLNVCYILINLQTMLLNSKCDHRIFWLSTGNLMVHVKQASSLQK